MEWKFFMRDVIGAKPTKKGDTFVALCFANEHEFRVTEIHGDMIFATLVR